MEKPNPSNQLLAISCEQRAQRLKRAKNLERGERGEEEVEEEERSGPGPVRNVIRPRKLQFSRGPGITARRHKIYSTRVRARARLLAVARFLIVRPNSDFLSRKLHPRFSPPLMLRSSCTRIKTTFVSAGFETKVVRIFRFLLPCATFRSEGVNESGVEPRNFEIFANFFHFLPFILDSWRNYFYTINKSNFIIDFIGIIISITQ